MRKSLADIYAEAHSDAWWKGYSVALQNYVAAKAVADAVTKRLKRKIAADARRKEMMESKWVLR